MVRVMEPAQETPQELQEKALAFVQERWRDIPCPRCGETEWGVAASVGLQSYPPIPRRVVPLFPITCQTCGYTDFLNGVIAGLFPRAKGSEQ